LVWWKEQAKNWRTKLWPTFSATTQKNKEISHSLIESFVSEKVDQAEKMKSIFSELQVLVDENVSIKKHRIKELERILGPEIDSKKNENFTAEKFNEVLQIQVTQKDRKIEFLEIKLNEKDQEIEKLKTIIKKLNLKMEEIEISKLQNSTKITKNEILVQEITDSEIIVKWILLEPTISKGTFVQLFRENDKNLISKKPVAVSKQKGELYFDRPNFISNYFFKLVNSKHEVLFVTEMIKISPKIEFSKVVVNGNKVDVNWINSDKKDTSYDWVGLYKLDQSSTQQYTTYNYIVRNKYSLSFDRPVSGSYKVCYFSGENKYFSIAESKFEVVSN